MKRFGIDVSKYQGATFDFNKAKAEGVEFVILRCGGGDVGLYKDSLFDRHYEAAKKAGLGVGAYFYSAAQSIAEVDVETDYCLYTLKNKQFEYPIFIDTEDARMKKVGKQILTSIVKHFCNNMERAGYWAGFYTNLDWYRNYLNGPELAKRYSFWLATWAKTMPNLPDIQMWQFGGNTNPIRSNMIAGVICDQDYCFVDYPSLIKAKGLNGFPKSTNNTSSPATKPVNTTTYAKDDKIRIAKGALVYGTNEKFYDFVYNSDFYILVDPNGGNRIVFGPERGNVYKVTGAVDKKYVIKV